MALVVLQSGLCYMNAIAEVISLASWSPRGSTTCPIMHLENILELEEGKRGKGAVCKKVGKR